MRINSFKTLQQMENLTTIKKTNNLKHRITTTDKKGNPLIIDIRLNDECKNGHQDFSITGSLYTKGKPLTDRNLQTCGCIHEIIADTKPMLQLFIDLHLCDYKGIPIYAVENGFYHLTQGFNNTKPDSQNFKDEFCSYYRVTPKQFDVLKSCANSVQYALVLQSEGILNQWEKQASKAIEKLEKMTGNSFLIDSTRTQYNAPTPEQLKEEEERHSIGYYTKEAEEAREHAKFDGLLKGLEADRDKEIAQAKLEYQAKKATLIAGGQKALDNCIFYNHTATLSFNWRGYNKLTDEHLESIKNKIILPKGVKIEFK